MEMKAQGEVPAQVEQQCEVQHEMHLLCCAIGEIGSLSEAMKSRVEEVCRPMGTVPPCTSEPDHPINAPLACRLAELRSHVNDHAGVLRDILDRMEL